MFSPKNYYKPTPKVWRNIGDSLLASATIVAVGGMYQFDNLKEIFTIPQIRYMVGTSIVVGVVGKFITNFFKADESANPPVSS